MGIIGGIATAIIGASSSRRAAQASRLGYDYLNNNALNQQAQAQGLAAGTQSGALLGLGGDQAAADQAFQQYQDSTGYQFRLDQGLGAVTQSAAASGLLNSGSTLKGLTEYGQNLASSEFQSYLSNLNNAQSTGLTAASNVASQGQSAGQAQAQYIQAGANDVAAGLGMALQGGSNYSTRPVADQSTSLWLY